MSPIRSLLKVCPSFCECAFLRTSHTCGDGCGPAFVATPVEWSPLNVSWKHSVVRSPNLTWSLLVALTLQVTTLAPVSRRLAAFYFYENHRHHGNETVYLGKIVALRGTLTRKKKRFWASYNFRGGIRNLSTPVLLDCRWLTSSRAIQHLWAVIISLTFLRPVNGKWESLCQNAPLQGLAPACLSPSPRLSRSLSLPPRWSSQLGWMRLIFNPSCANGSLARRECSMHSNLSHRLIYSLSQKKEGKKVRGFICGKTCIFLQGSFRISSLFSLARVSNSWFQPIENKAWRFH